MWMLCCTGLLFFVAASSDAAPDMTSVNSLMKIPEVMEERAYVPPLPLLVNDSYEPGDTEDYLDVSNMATERRKRHAGSYHFAPSHAFLPEDDVPVYRQCCMAAGPRPCCGTMTSRRDFNTCCRTSPQHPSHSAFAAGAVDGSRQPTNGAQPCCLSSRPPSCCFAVSFAIRASCCVANGGSSSAALQAAGSVMSCCSSSTPRVTCCAVAAVMHVEAPCCTASGVRLQRSCCMSFNRPECCARAAWQRHAPHCCPGTGQASRGRVSAFRQRHSRASCCAARVKSVCCSATGGSFRPLCCSAEPERRLQNVVRECCSMEAPRHAECCSYSRSVAVLVPCCSPPAEEEAQPECCSVPLAQRDACCSFAASSPRCCPSAMDVHVLQAPAGDCCSSSSRPSCCSTAFSPVARAVCCDTALYPQHESCCRVVTVLDLNRCCLSTTVVSACCIVPVTTPPPPPETTTMSPPPPPTTTTTSTTNAPTLGPLPEPNINPEPVEMNCCGSSSPSHRRQCCSAASPVLVLRLPCCVSSRPFQSARASSFGCCSPSASPDCCSSADSAARRCCPPNFVDPSYSSGGLAARCCGMANDQTTSCCRSVMARGNDPPPCCVRVYIDPMGQAAPMLGYVPPRGDSICCDRLAPRSCCTAYTRVSASSSFNPPPQRAEPCCCGSRRCSSSSFQHHQSPYPSCCHMRAAVRISCCASTAYLAPCCSSMRLR